MSSVGHEFELAPDRARYDLTDAEMKQCVAEFLKNSSGEPSAKIECYAVSDDDMANVARTVERTVFEHSFGNDASQMEEIYGDYEAASTFFLSVDTEQQRPVGALRAISNSPAGLMTFNTLPGEATQLTSDQISQHYDMGLHDTTWDIGTVAVLPEYRRDGKGVSVQLYRAMYLSALREGIEHLTSIIDERPLETMTKYLGIPFEQMVGTQPFSYEGSAQSVAVHGYVPDFYTKMRRKSLTPRGLLARKALWPLVFGREDAAIHLDTTQGEK